MAAGQAQNPPGPPLLQPPPLLQIPPRPAQHLVNVPPPNLGNPGNPPLRQPARPPQPTPDGNLGSLIDPGWFKVVIMRCTAGLHEGAASVTLDWWQGTWYFLPNEFMASVLQATSSLPVQHLILKHHKLCNLPTNLASMDTLLPCSLTTLDLSFNCFVALPPIVCQLVELRELFLTNNQICRLPYEMPNLKNLEVLHLQYNQFKALPVCVCRLTSLKFLNLENNVIESIPEEVGQLSTLQSLYLKSNKIKALPPSITQLSSLEELHLTDNILRRLPQYWEGCTSLKQLYLANNNLRFLPFSVINLHKLQGLTLSGNKLKFPPLSACRQGLSSLKVFMLEKYRSSSQVWSSSDGTASLTISDNLYYDSEDSDTPYEDVDRDPEQKVGVNDAS